MTKVKICGITNLEDALAACQAGADLLGFIFYEPSPRYVRPHRVKTILSDLRRVVTENFQPILPQFVGVFVNAAQEDVSRILVECQLDRAQLHGEEPPDYVAQFPAQAFKAMRPKSEREAGQLVERYLPKAAACPAPYFLIDAYHPTLYGGTGQVTDWAMAAAIARDHPIMLAGSLTPENVGGAIEAVRPWGVDVSGGVEAEKGKKDHQKIKAFMAAVRQVQDRT